MTGRSIHETTGYLLSQVCKLRRSRGSTRLEEIGLYRGQHFVLAALWEQDGLTHSELADQLYVRPATITNALKRMETAGLVERRRDDRDQRVSHAYLTDAGRRIRSDVERVWAALDEKAFGDLSPEEALQFRRLLFRIRESLLRDR